MNSFTNQGLEIVESKQIDLFKSDNSQDEVLNSSRNGTKKNKILVPF